MTAVMPFEILAALFACHFDGLLFIPRNVLISTPYGEFITVLFEAANA